MKNSKGAAVKMPVFAPSQHTVERREDFKEFHERGPSYNFPDSMPEEEGFLKTLAGGADDSFDNFGSQQMLIMGEDLNKMQQNFAGDTFSQISSTYEQQPPVNLVIQNQGQSHQEAGPGVRNQGKILSYKEKRPRHSHCQNDELLDSAILNGIGSDSPKGELGNGNQILKLDFPQNPSALSNNLGLLMDNLQQSEMQSTATVYNSGIFDDASIMRILDKSISDDSIFHDASKGGDQGGRSCAEIEASLKFECEDVSQILINVGGKLKERLQKQRSVHSQSQIVAISIEELKQLEILTSSAIEKVRQISSNGKSMIEAQRIKGLTLKNYKQNLKIQLHNQIQKFKEVSRKQYLQAERHKFKYQINEFELNEKVKGMEDRFERQNAEINKLANRCEQLKYERQQVQLRYENKLSKVEAVVSQLTKVTNETNNGLAGRQKPNNSFCLGSDHSMLLPQKRHLYKQMLKQKHQDLQQSVDEGDKENSSIMSNGKAGSNEIRSILKQLQLILAEKEIDQSKNQLFHVQEGGSYFESSSMFRLIGDLDVQRDSLIQQSQFVPAESHASVNQAFIQSQTSSHISEKQDALNQKFINLDNEDNGGNESVEYNFRQEHIIGMGDGNSQNLFDQCGGDVQFLDEKISTKDLAPRRETEMSDTQRIAIDQQKRRQMLGQKAANQFDFMNQSSIENSMEDDLKILQNLYKEEKKEDTIFQVDLSGIDNSINNFKGKSGGVQFGSGRNIFIADEFTGGSIDLESRNEKLYSGGSSQLSMMQAFQSLRRPPPSTEVVVVNVRDRKISFPKLDLRIVQETGELYRGNLPNTGFHEDSSILTESQIPETAKTHAQQMAMMQAETTNHINSFENESISKQYPSKFESIDGGIQSLLLDKAICIDNSKINNSNESSKEASHGKHGVFNLLDSFKQELGMMDQASNKNNSFLKSNGHQIQLMPKPEEEPNQKQPLPRPDSRAEDKSLDLSVNISCFKKSLSDPNLIFNDVNSSDDDIKPNKRTEVEDSRAKNTSNIQQILAFKKLKTPQGNQNKLKFNMPQEMKGGLAPVQGKRMSLCSIQSRLRSDSSNSRQKAEIQTETNYSQPNKIKSMFKIQKLSIKGLKNGGDKTVIEDVDRSVLTTMHGPTNFSVIQGHNESPDRHPDDHSKAIIQRIMKKQRRDDQKLQNEVSQIQKPQLIQNYIIQAAAMGSSNNNSQIRKGQIKLSKGSVGRNSLFGNAMNTSNSEQDEQPAKPKVTHTMIQQMKEYQESHDISKLQGVARQPTEQPSLLLSPSKGQQRSSQSCTPQKKGKGIIVVSKQILKAIPKKINLNNLTNIDGPDNDSSVMKPATILRKKIQIIRPNPQNMTAMNQSIDQSHLLMHPGGHVDESTLGLDNQSQSLLISDISVLNPPRSIPTKTKIKKVKTGASDYNTTRPQETPGLQPTSSSTQIGLIANKNLQNLIQSNQTVLKNNNLSNNQAIAQKLLLQKQAIASNQHNSVPHEAKQPSPPVAEEQSRLQKRRRDLLKRAQMN